MNLTADNVRSVAQKCLFTDAEFRDGEDVPAGAVVVDGIVGKYAFHQDRLADNTGDIASLLSGLEDSFMSEGGGGMSFLQACMDRSGNHWGEHPTMGLLFGLGIGAGLCFYTLPREMWAVLPGGVPYITIDSSKVKAATEHA